MKRILPMICALGLFFPVGMIYAGEETQIVIDMVPTEILKTAQECLPEATFLLANTEMEEDGRKVFEVQGEYEDGRRVEVDIYESGEIQEYEIEFKQNNVPGAVFAAINRKYPGFTPSFIEASHSKTGKVVQYEFEGFLKEKKIDLEVSASGREIVEADN